jgi:hypothetical protein
LKTIPLFGKSGTSRTPTRNFSITSAVIGATLATCGQTSMAIDQ